MTILKNVHSAARRRATATSPTRSCRSSTRCRTSRTSTARRRSWPVPRRRSGPGGRHADVPPQAGDFTLLLGDSAGPIFEHPPVRAALDRLPGCVDVMANAILGFDQPVSGLQDPSLRGERPPAVFLPTHADAWAPALSAGQAAYRDQLRRSSARCRNPPEEIDHLLDPVDYMRERAYRYDDPRWRVPMPGLVLHRGGGLTAGRADPPEGVARVRAAGRHALPLSRACRGRPVPGATIRFGASRVRTGAGGRAAMTRRFRRPGLPRRAPRRRACCRVATRYACGVPAGRASSRPAEHQPPRLRGRASCGTMRAAGGGRGVRRASSSSGPRARRPAPPSRRSAASPGAADGA